MTKSLSLFVFGAIILLFGAARGADRGFIAKNIKIEGETYSYQIFVPEKWSPLQKWPVVLFLHGAGERGSDGVKQTEVGIGPAIRRDPSAMPAVVVMPQCRRGVWWNAPAMEQLALASLDQAIQEYNGDRQRIFLTGLSMGGYGTFYLGAKYPDRFAALVPICGGVVPPNQLRGGSGTTDRSGVYAEAAQKIGQTPIWIFHGGADPVVPVGESRRMTEALKKIGSPVKYTEFPGVGHNSWDDAYSDPGLITWMLSQRR